MPSSDRSVYYRISKVELFVRLIYGLTKLLFIFYYICVLEIISSFCLLLILMLEMTEDISSIWQYFYMDCVLISLKP